MREFAGGELWFVVLWARGRGGRKEKGGRGRVRSGLQ